MPRFRRMLLTAATILTFLILAGATYQGVATALERRQFRHPGRLVDIGDRQLHIHCLGEGTPIVVLEAPAAGMSVAWGWVQTAVAQTTRVCSYDRAGLGWSEAGDAPYDPSAVPYHLHALLERAGESAPYIVVGHGLGAAFARLYAGRFGREVAAVVLVDPPAPEADRRAGSVELVHASPWLARAGILRVTRLLSNEARGLPEASKGPLSAFLNRPDHLTRAARELSLWDDTIRLAEETPLEAGLPIVEITDAAAARVSFLTDAGRADEVTTAISAAVAQLRQRPSAGSN